MRFFKANCIYILILLPAIYFAVFLHLDSQSFRMWDESFLGVHTYEMMANHDYIVTHTFGAPEMLNTKPPLAIWCMIASSKAIGFSELSVRLPNAIAGVFICLLLYLFVSIYLNSPLTAFLSVLILISCSGFIGPHVIRTGEYDALLTLFTLIYSLCFFLMIECIDTQYIRRLWIIFTVAVIAAVLTKGIAGFMMLPGLLVYTIIRQKLYVFVTSPGLYFSIFFVLFFGLGYYLLREHLNPGYLQAVNDQELAGRYVQPNDGHRGGFIYYWSLLAGSQFAFVILFIVIGIIRPLLSDVRSRLESFIVYGITISVVFICVISIAATKLYWYDAPVLPIIALVGAYGLYAILDLFSRYTKINKAASLGCKVCLILIIILPSYTKIIVSNLNPWEAPWTVEQYSVPDYIKKQEARGVNLDGCKVLPDHDMRRAQMCQITELRAKGQRLEIVEIDSLIAGDKVVTKNADQRTRIMDHFYYQQTDHEDNIEVWKLLKTKEIVHSRD